MTSVRLFIKYIDENMHTKYIYGNTKYIKRENETYNNELLRKF